MRKVITKTRAGKEEDESIVIIFLEKLLSLENKKMCTVLPTTKSECEKKRRLGLIDKLFSVHQNLTLKS